MKRISLDLPTPIPDDPSLSPLEGDEMDIWLVEDDNVREASSDDHFYGPWKGGGKGAGGRPAAASDPGAAAPLPFDQPHYDDVNVLAYKTGEALDFNTYIDLRGVDPANAHEAMAEFRALARDYPDTAASITDILAAPPGGGGIPPMAKSIYADCQDLGGKSIIRLNSEEFGRPDVSKALHSQYASHWFTADGVSGTVSHEFGHAYSNAHPAEVKGFMAGFANLVGDPHAMKGIAPSKYSRTNILGAEHWAELFAEARGPKTAEQLSTGGRLTREWLAGNGLR